MSPSLDALNVLGGPLEECGQDPVTGFWRNGFCAAGPEDPGRHTVCAVMTAEFLDHQVRTGNDLVTPIPAYRFPGLRPGDRWCVVALRWLDAFEAGCPAPVVLSATHESTTEVIPLYVLLPYAVDVPDDPRDLAP